MKSVHYHLQKSDYVSPYKPLPPALAFTYKERQYFKIILFCNFYFHKNNFRGSSFHFCNLIVYESGFTHPKVFELHSAKKLTINNKFIFLTRIQVFKYLKIQWRHISIDKYILCNEDN